MMMTTRTLTICGALLGLACLAHTQSLGEVAKRTKDQRKASDAGKTYTQDDLDRAWAARKDTAPAEPAPTASPTESHSAAQTGSPTQLRSPSVAPRQADSPSSEMAELAGKIHMWQVRYQVAKASVERIERKIAALEAERFRPRAQTVDQSIDARLADARRTLVEEQKKLDAIVEQARLDGVTAGQLY